jgi:hypothetical protein
MNTPANGIEPLDIELRPQQIKQRRLEIAATLATWKREFFVNGVEREFGERLALEEEDARLALEANVIKAAANAAKVERRRLIDAGMLPQLIQLLNERGFGGFVTEAEKRVEALLIEEQRIAA